MSADRVGRRHQELLRILLVGLSLSFCPLALLHHTLRVGDSRAHLDDDWSVILFGELVGCSCIRQRLRRIARLQHGQLGCYGVMAGILLILGRMHSRVIRDDYDHACVHTCVGRGVHGVCGYVHADVLHRAHAASARERRAKRHFHGNLLIRRPLTVDISEQRDLFRDLRARCSRIT